MKKYLVYNVNYFIFTLNLQNNGRKKHHRTGKLSNHSANDETETKQQLNDNSSNLFFTLGHCGIYMCNNTIL
jgi:hypothetical protein